MSRVVTEHYDFLLNQAEAARMCLIPDNASAHRHYNHLVSKGKLIAPLRGIFARREYWDSLTPDKRHLHMVRALSKKHPDWVFSHFTAALVYGLYVSYSDLQLIHRSIGYCVKSKHEGICCHSVGVRGSEEVSGIRVTSFEQTVYDCLRLSDFKHGLPIADSACRLRGLLPGDLLGIIDSFSGKYTGGLATARLAAQHSNGKSESGGESIARAAMLMNGYLVPELQVWFPDPVDEGERFRVDFYWELPGKGQLIGEFDGKGKYVDPGLTSGRELEDILIDERKRESHINALRIPVMRMSYADVCNDAVFQNLMDAFGVPRVSEAW